MFSARSSELADPSAKFGSSSTEAKGPGRLESCPIHDRTGNTPAVTSIRPSGQGIENNYPGLTSSVLSLPPTRSFQGTWKPHVTEVQQDTLKKFFPFGMPMLIDRVGRLARCQEVRKSPEEEIDTRWVQDSISKDTMTADPRALRPDYFSLIPESSRHFWVGAAFPGAGQFYTDHLRATCEEVELLKSASIVAIFKTFYDGEGTIDSCSMQRAGILQGAIRLLLAPFRYTKTFFLFIEQFDCTGEASVFFTTARGDGPARSTAKFWLIICRRSSHWFLAIIDVDRRVVWIHDTQVTPDEAQKVGLDIGSGLTEVLGDGVEFTTRVVDAIHHKDEWMCWLFTIEAARSFLYNTDFNREEVEFLGFKHAAEYRGLEYEDISLNIQDRYRAMFRNLLGQDTSVPMFPYNNRERRSFMSTQPLDEPYTTYRKKRIEKGWATPQAPWEGDGQDHFVPPPLRNPFAEARCPGAATTADPASTTKVTTTTAIEQPAPPYSGVCGEETAIPPTPPEDPNDEAHLLSLLPVFDHSSYRRHLSPDYPHDFAAKRWPTQTARKTPADYSRQSAGQDHEYRKSLGYGRYAEELLATEKKRTEAGKKSRKMDEDARDDKSQNSLG